MQQRVYQNVNTVLMASVLRQILAYAIQGFEDKMISVVYRTVTVLMANVYLLETVLAIRVTCILMKQRVLLNVITVQTENALLQMFVLVIVDMCMSGVSVDLCVQYLALTGFARPLMCVCVMMVTRRTKME